MLKCAVIGASGYTGAELVLLLTSHKQFQLTGLWVSAGSDVAGQFFSQQYPQALGRCDLTFQALAGDAELAKIADSNQLVFLCTDHQVSHDLAPKLIAKGAKVMDLSGAYRLQEMELYSQFYGFEHKHPALLKSAIYGLIGWNDAAIKTADIVAVPGCYPTAASLALMPLVQAKLLASNSKPVINAISGISGAGKKPSMVNSFCELSLKPYNLFQHRHQPEIEQTLSHDVVFTPHIGNFDRGILATIYCQLKPNVTQTMLSDLYDQAYGDHDTVYCVDQIPSINDVKMTPNCHLYWSLREKENELIVISAIDNLLKGAAGQALNCAELSCL